jgi:AraC family transcriptional regulator
VTDVHVEDRPALRLAAVRHLGPYDRIHLAFDRLHALVAEAGLQPLGLIGLFHDDPRRTPAEALRSDAAVIVAEGVPLPPGLQDTRLPAGRYATTMHVGPYATLGEAWRHLLHEAVPALGERVGPGITYERYLNTPGQVPDAELQTELCAPLA